MRMRSRSPLYGLLALIAALAGAVSLLSSFAEAAPAAAPAAQRPDWHALPLTDARTGQTFTLADLAGKTVYVEPMATWCTNCRHQMSLIRDHVSGQVDPEQVAFVGLSVETNLTGETLAAYADSNGFDWTFAVMTPELLQGLASHFGRTVANPPAVPHFVVSPDGTTSELTTGQQSAEQLLERLSLAAAGQP